MDSKVSENKVSRPLRRSTRQSSVKVMSYEPTPRGPLKRTKKHPESQAHVRAVNGSREVENGSEDEESPSKKSRLETGEAVGSSGDENQMEVQEEEMESSQDQEIEIGQDSSHDIHQPKICKGAIGDVNLSPRVLLGERCQSSRSENEDADLVKTKMVKPSTTKPHVQIRSAANKHDTPITKITSIAEYQSRMKAKTESAGVHTTYNHHIPIKYPASEKSCTTKITTQQCVNNTARLKHTFQHKKQEELKKTAAIKRTSKSSCRGCMWYLWALVLLVLLTSAALLAYKKIPILQMTVDKERHSFRDANSQVFAEHLLHLETQFPSQQLDLWKRSKIHLERHLKTANPTEPVSLILTAGLRAEKTLQCLAQGLASSFSSSLSGSVLYINGASKASLDSDEVKLDIDNQLQAAFEGGKPAAVIHRVEELPPGSTLIFYRYCDHENAAFKRVFLLFTVLLPQDEVSSELSLKNVEEMVQDYVQERLVGSTKQTTFNEMDTNKFGGLWSRISHLILPVVSEKEIEQKGC